MNLKMKKLVLTVLMCLVALSSYSCARNDEPATLESGKTDVPANEKRILVAYFSWGGTTKRLAEEIASLTGGDLFSIEIVTPYPTEYTPYTEVAKEEVDKGIRPPLKSVVRNMDDYDIVFVGCPVWWHTAPMVIWSFLESKEYNFKGKIIVPFCTYAATYRDETLTKIVELTPGSEHLEGFGSTGSTEGVKDWLKKIIK